MKLETARKKTRAALLAASKSGSNFVILPLDVARVLMSGRDGSPAEEVSETQKPGFLRSDTQGKGKLK